MWPADIPLVMPSHKIKIMFTETTNKIAETLENYFEGIFYGDVQKLRSTFADHTWLYGDIKGVAYFKSLKEYLEGVQNRQSPHELGEEFRMKIIGIEKLGKIAIAKVHVPMLGYNYYDYLSLSQIDAEWKIVSKIFTHVE